MNELNPNFTEEKDYLDDGKQPTSTAREDAKMANYVDENQVASVPAWMIKTVKGMNKQTIISKLMKIHPTVYIAPRDFMPQCICNTCLNNFFFISNIFKSITMFDSTTTSFIN